MSRHLDGSPGGTQGWPLLAFHTRFLRCLVRTTNTPCLLILLFMTGSAFGEDSSDYRASLKRLHNRLNALETQRLDYRKQQPSLPQELENERLQLMGRLLEEDPVWAFSKDLQSDLEAVAARKNRGEGDDAALEALKDLLALTSGATEIAASRQEASALAARLREFKVSRDVAGATEWLKQRTK